MKQKLFKSFYFIFYILMNSNSFAFTLNSSTSSNFKGWNNPNIKFQLNLTNCPTNVDVSGIINDALAIWNNVAPSRVNVSVVGNTTSVTYSDPITIICDVNYGSESPGAADGSPGAASIQPSTGDSITSGIMYLNASSGRANISNLDRNLVAVTLAHEIGHLLGLGHSQDLNALMYYNASLKTHLGLAQDDIDGITYLYPRNEFDKDKMMGGCGAISNPKNPKNPSNYNLLILVLILIMPVIFARYLKSTIAKKGI